MEFHEKYFCWLKSNELGWIKEKVLLKEEYYKKIVEEIKQNIHD